MEALFPPKVLPLFEPAPYKVLYGGRGASKTWAFCRALLILGAREVHTPLFILCAREIQKSIAESVHRVLATQLVPLGLADFYEVQSHRIIGRNGTQFVFAGIKNNINAIKSMEGIDICAVIEANGVSAYSWDTLLPTIRRDPPYGPFGKGSEIWVEFNPELATDETYKRWVLNPPHGTFVREINHSDNPWFPDISRRQMDEMRKRDYENYLTIWEGKVRRVVQGAIYAKELEAAMMSGRVSPNVRHDKSRAVDIGVDLGRADTCCLWFVQQWGMEHRFVDYYSNVGYDWSHYLEEIQGRRYRIGKIYLPHDGRHETVAAKKSIEAQTKDAYPNDGQVVVVERTPNVVNDINAVRMTFPRFCFNEEKCTDGLQALAHYKYDVDEENKDPKGNAVRALKPLHTWASHGADALRCYVMGLQTGDRFKRQQMHMPSPGPQPGSVPRGLGWMT
jgi:phage terminase large subunit